MEANNINVAAPVVSELTGVLERIAEYVMRVAVKHAEQMIEARVDAQVKAALNDIERTVSSLAHEIAETKERMSNLDRAWNDLPNFADFVARGQMEDYVSDEIATAKAAMESEVEDSLKYMASAEFVREEINCALESFDIEAAVREAGVMTESEVEDAIERAFRDYDFADALRDAGGVTEDDMERRVNRAVDDAIDEIDWGDVLNMTDLVTRDELTQRVRDVIDEEGRDMIDTITHVAVGDMVKTAVEESNKRNDDRFLTTDGLVYEVLHAGTSDMQLDTALARAVLSGLTKALDAITAK